MSRRSGQRARAAAAGLRRPLCAAIVSCAVGLLSWGCSDEVPPRASDERPTAGRTVTLTGCVAGAVEPDAYRLNRIRIDAGHSPTPDLPQAPPVPGITEGAWVRLEGGAPDLSRLLGRRVRLTGQVAETGANTIGTAGAWGTEVPSGDKSQAASDEHYAEKQKKEAGRIARQSLANGRAAKLRVIEVTDLAERCEAGPPVEGRR